MSSEIICIIFLLTNQEATDPEKAEMFNLVIFFFFFLFISFYFLRNPSLWKSLVSLLEFIIEQNKKYSH